MPQAIDPTFLALPRRALADAALTRARELGRRPRRLPPRTGQGGPPAGPGPRARRSPGRRGVRVRGEGGPRRHLGLRGRHRPHPRRRGRASPSRPSRWPAPRGRSAPSGWSWPTNRSTPTPTWVSAYRRQPLRRAGGRPGPAAHGLDGPAAGGRRRRPRRRVGPRRPGEQVLRRRGGHRHHPATGADPPAGHRRVGGSRLGGLRDDAHPGPARRPGLGVPDRDGLGLGRRARPAPRAAGRADGRARRRRRHLRPGDRPVQPVAHHPRVDRPRHRARPGPRLRGGLRRHVVRHLRPAGAPAVRRRRSCTSPATGSPSTGWRPSASTTRGWRPRPGTSSATASSSATSSTGAWPPWQRLGRSNGCAFADSPQPRPAAAHGQRVAPAGGRRAVHRGADRRGRRGASTSSATRAGRSTCSATTSSSPVSASTGSTAGGWPGRSSDVAYQGTTTDFWGSMEAVGGPETYVLGGAFNCGKAQPGQVAAVSHGCPSRPVPRVRILNTVREAGR